MKNLQNKYKNLKKSYKININILLYFRTILFFFYSFLVRFSFSYFIKILKIITNFNSKIFFFF